MKSVVRKPTYSLNKLSFIIISRKFPPPNSLYHYNLLSTEIIALIFLNRRDAVILRRLCIGHTRLTHHYLLTRDEPPQCPSSNYALTVVHILIECQQH